MAVLVVSVTLFGCDAQMGYADVVARQAPYNRMHADCLSSAQSVAVTAKNISAASNDAKKKFMSMYEDITLKTTYNDVVGKWGEGTKKNVKVSERYYLWKRGNAGVYISFSADGKISSKNLYFGKPSDLAKFSKPITAKMLTGVKTGMSYADVAKALGGDGVETARQYQKGDQYHRHVHWANSNGSYAQCVFDEKGKLITLVKYRLT